MILRSIHNDGDLNMKGLSFDAPKSASECYFDPERDIAKDDWENMAGEFFGRNREKPMLPANLAQLASTMYLLRPTAFQKIDLPEATKDAIRTIMESELRKITCDEVIFFLGHALFSDSQRPIRIEPDIVRQLTGPLEGYVRSSAPLGHIVQTAVRVLRLSPAEIPASGLDVMLVGELCNTIRQQIAAADRSLPFRFDEYTASLKILSCHFNGNFFLQQEDWCWMTETLQWLRETNQWNAFAHQVLNMTISGAHDVRFDSNGRLAITLRAPADNTSHIPDIPQMRSFLDSIPS